MKIGENEHVIDNTHDEGKWFDKSRLIWIEIGSSLIEEDPATTERTFRGPQSDLKITGGIGSKNLRLVCGQDEKMEQRLAYVVTCNFNVGFTLYDIEMRKYIKEKYGVELESLPKKWSRLCWNCFDNKEDLKKCSNCQIAQYCTKDCQRQDWKVHKVLHSMEEYWKPFVEQGDL